MPHPGVPRDWFRNKDGMGLWEGRGKVCATGVGTAPTARRWDEKPENSMGALTIFAIRKAIEDAGISPGWDSVFKMADYPQAGITRGDIDWVLLNMPELTNVNFKMYGPTCMSVSF